MTILNATMTLPAPPALMQKIASLLAAQDTEGAASSEAYCEAVADARKHLLRDARKGLSGCFRKRLEMAVTDTAGC